MSNFRYRLALLTAKFSVAALRVTGHKGTDFPGRVAEKICPDFLKYVPKPEKIYAVTGTNGKTTVSNLIKDSLAAFGEDVLNNSAGSNTYTGIATCFIHGVTLSGKEKYKTAVLEIDERSARLVYPFVSPDYLIITNLTRDSIMRNGHPEYIRDILTRYMPDATTLVINSDNLISTLVAPKNPRVYFSIDRQPGDPVVPHNRINDFQICPNCSTRMEFSYIRYSNVGKVRCPGCGLTSPESDYHISVVDHENGTIKVVREGPSKREAVFPQISPTIFNLYNELAVITLLDLLGYGFDRSEPVMEKMHVTESRFGEVKVGDVTILKVLGKDRNAYATSRVFELIHDDPGDKEVMMYNNNLDDARHWSENTCWLYDCDFELLADDKVKQVIVFGDRALDYKLRLMTAGVPEERIVVVKEPEDGVSHLLGLPGETVYVIYGTAPVEVGSRIFDMAAEEMRRRMESGMEPGVRPEKALEEAGAGTDGRKPSKAEGKESSK